MSTIVVHAQVARSSITWNREMAVFEPASVIKTEENVKWNNRRNVQFAYISQ